jgi:chromosome segregation ATPase
MPLFWGYRGGVAVVVPNHADPRDPRPYTEELFMRRILVPFSFAFLLAASMSGTSILARQGGQDPDVLNALLVEVRGLRAAMEQLAAAGPRVQLAMGRLQLHEQRITTLARRLDEIRDARVIAERELEQKKREVSAIQAVLRHEGRAGGTEEEEALKDARAQVSAANANVQRLVNEETAISAEIATEQGRWAEINQRLEELDRALTRR